MIPRIVESPPQTDATLAQAMLSYGIQRVPVDYFHWNGYRYGSLKDAIAAARRAQGAGTAHV
ncbi:hypothetical protein IAG41_04340 [Sphingomonas sp. JC676]|uniref:hypothetical protein n=1 Tax=Sphingomonas sp. JC676 TaxID=2768065 RepID=UPI0016581363|nr:hypothetical protein [Sphingomonas sp. JC676]MBC9031614.1 hypothetical protein [Sphingomonas sp. JC676]